jgi:uncharacterized membrane protein
VRIRRVTLVHAIFSFLFVTAIIGFVVNVISNVTSPSVVDGVK